MKGPVQEWGAKWGSYWWIAYFSALDRDGIYTIKVTDAEKTILTSDPVVIRKNALWSNCFKTIAFDFLEKKKRSWPP